jgi:ABC-type multidrug transport system permease subunit
MIPTLLASGIVLYGIIQFFVALLAVVFSLKWNKPEFLAGLFFLLLYSLVEVIDLYLITVVHAIYFDVAQFGFILLAIIFFIVGMHPEWMHKMKFMSKSKDIRQSNSRHDSIISILRKM